MKQIIKKSTISITLATFLTGCVSIGGNIGVNESLYNGYFNYSGTDYEKAIIDKRHNEAISEIKENDKECLKKYGDRGYTALQLSIKHHNEKTANYLIDNKICDVNDKNKNGLSVLHMGNDMSDDLYKKVINSNANMNVKYANQTPLKYMMNNNNASKVKLLLDAGADINNEIIAMNVNGDKARAFFDSQMMKLHKGISSVKSDKEGKLFLDNRIDIIGQIAKKLDTDFKVSDVVNIAIYRNGTNKALEVAGLLNEKIQKQNNKKDIAFLNDFLVKDSEGNVKDLNVKALNNVNDKLNYLKFAIAYNDVKTTKALLLSDKELFKHKLGYSGLPLELAINSNKLEIAKMLVDAGADVSVKNNMGLTPLDVLNKQFKNKASINNDELISLKKDLMPTSKNIHNNLKTKPSKKYTISHFNNAVERYIKNIENKNKEEKNFKLLKTIYDKGGTGSLKYKRTSIIHEMTKHLDSKLLDKRLTELKMRGFDINVKANVYEKYGETNALYYLTELDNYSLDKYKVLINQGMKLDGNSNSSVLYNFIYNNQTNLNPNNNYTKDAKKNIEILKMLIEAGADINYKIWTTTSIFHLIIQTRNKELIDFIINAGVDFNSILSSLDIKKIATIENLIKTDKKILLKILDLGLRKDFNNSYTIQDRILRELNKEEIQFLLKQGLNFNKLNSKMKKNYKDKLN